MLVETSSPFFVLAACAFPFRVRFATFACLAQALYIGTVRTGMFANDCYSPKINSASRNHLSFGGHSETLLFAFDIYRYLIVCTAELNNSF